MFWDKVAFAYDFFENTYNGKVYANTGKKVAEQIESEDEVLECACGTGAISIFIAPKCKLKNAGYEHVEYHVVEGKMPCAIAVITKFSSKE